MLTRTVDLSREKEMETIVSACDLFGVSRQVYYRSKKSIKQKQITASKVVDMVQEIRCDMPRMGTRKLYFLLQYQLSEIYVLV